MTQVCLGLVQHSYDVAEDFFKTKEIVLVPNCSMGMKCVLEALVKKNQSMTAAYLGPIYSSTKNLLQCFEQDGLVRKVLDPILPGTFVALLVTAKLRATRSYKHVDQRSF